MGHARSPPGVCADALKMLQENPRTEGKIAVGFCARLVITHTGSLTLTGDVGPGPMLHFAPRP